MILDGNTDWNPDDHDDAIDPGATVGIGPLPQRSPAGQAGPVDDPENEPPIVVTPLAESSHDEPRSANAADVDRPPMFTETGPVEDESDPAPHGWIATGPLSAGVPGIDPLPTGPIPVTVAPVSTVTSSAPSARVILQAGVVLFAAGLVGLVVFGVLRSAADDSTGDRAGIDRSDGLALDPGPGVSGGGGDRLDSKRGTAGVGQQPESADDGTDDGRGQAGTGADSDGAADPASPSTTSVISAETEQVSGPTDQGDDPTGSVDADDRSGPPTTLGQRPVTPTTSSLGGSTTAVTSNRPTTIAGNPSTRPTIGSSTTNRPASTRPGGSSTTRPATTRPSTSAPSTTARPTTTTTTSLPASLIAAPLDGSTVSWDARLRLQANAVPGADSYCWTLAGSGGELTQCSGDAELRFPAGRAVPGPGTVKIRAEVRAGSGAVLLSQEISINLLAQRFVTAPRAGRSVALDDGLRLQARRNPRADRYCWTLSQGSTRSGPLCTADRRLDLPADSPSLAGFSAGPVTARASAERGGVVIGRQTVAFEFTAS